MSKIKIPHTLVLMFMMMMAALVLTWVLPTGSFERQMVDGQTVVTPGSFELHEDAEILGPQTLLTVIPRALAAAQDVIFFVFLIGGVLGIIRHTGALDAVIGKMLQKFGDRMGLLIFSGMFIFGLFSSLIGMAAEYVVFVGLLVGLCRAIKLDAMVAMGILVVGYGVGYGLSLFNPFTVVIAQAIAEVQPGSGAWLRIALLVPIFLVGFHHVYSYAKKVKADPKNSLLYDVPGDEVISDPDAYPDFNRTHIMVLVAFGLTLATLVYGISQQGWYLTELSALFVGLGIATIFIGRIKFDEAAQKFIDGAAQLTATALLVGFARSIAMILEDGQVLDTVIYYLSMPIDMMGSYFGAVGMLLIQSLLNLFIPSGSGQAFVTMPIMVPIADTAEIGRQVAVLAFQMGDGFMNMIVPTNPVLMGILGLAGIPYDRWFRFMAPLMLKLLVVCSLALMFAVLVGY
ncbi:short-chain fatty acid transporter [Aliidiomarina minuta]|uniref:Short-chain fatty acid transporter n=1 Tax=Aliidiomarina minuta TaxID=880057 RepID=A0A432W3F5_9GAMM|nr:TIGR00366 family protein [Aliidiomarina minuta]RUO23862.1 short-chain fatty acid transporter [Aliidiomarina minuta]